MATDDTIHCRILGTKIWHKARDIQRKVPHGGLATEIYDFIDIELSELTTAQQLQVFATAPEHSTFSVNNVPKPAAIREIARQCLEAQLLEFAGIDPAIAGLAANELDRV